MKNNNKFRENLSQNILTRSEYNEEIWSRVSLEQNGVYNEDKVEEAQIYFDTDCCSEKSEMKRDHYQ